MRRTTLFVTVLFALCCASVKLNGQSDTTFYPSVTAFLQSLSAVPADTICARVDALVDGLADRGSDIQSKVAGLAFDFFNNSPVMGHDAVSVHIADKYFISGKLEWKDKESYPALYAFAQFNRASLIGCSAPQLELETFQGHRCSLRDDPSPVKVLYFYDTQCQTCRKETPTLISFLNNYSGPALTLFAFYTQSDRDAWIAYISDFFDHIDNPLVNVVNIWDPEVVTSFHMKYGVLTTPMMFLIDNQNIISGRRLDVDALGQLLGQSQQLAKDYASLMDDLFYEVTDYQYVESVIDALYRKSCGDSALAGEVLYHTYNYLRTSDNPILQKGAVSLADKYIVGSPGLWSEEYVARVAHSVSMARLNPPGQKASDLLLQNEEGSDVSLLKSHRGLRRRYSVVLFHLVGCEKCKETVSELMALSDFLADHRVTVKLVYSGEDFDLWRQFVKNNRLVEGKKWLYLADLKGRSRMHQLYDLEYVPHLYLLDDKGRVLAKDIPADDLLQLVD